MKQRFDKVPNLYQITHLRQIVKEILQTHPQEPFTYVKYLSLLVFLVHSESKCCIGPFLHFSKAEFDEMKNEKVPTTFEHNTGSNFPNFIQITEEICNGSNTFTKSVLKKKTGRPQSLRFHSQVTKNSHVRQNSSRRP